MAKDTHVRYSLTVLDGFGTSAACQAYVFMDSTATVGALKTNLETWRDLVAAVCSGQVTHSAVHILDAGGATQDPDTLAASRDEQTGVFRWSNTANKRSWSFAIPALSNGVITGDKVDLSNAGITALHAGMTASGATFNFETADQYALQAITQTSISFRKHRKQLGPRSREVGG